MILAASVLRTPTRDVLPLKKPADPVILIADLSPHAFWCRLLTLAKSEPTSWVFHRGTQ